MTGIHHKQRRILAAGKVRFIGEEVVAVVAEDEEIARDAVDLIRVEYEELPVVLDARSGAAERHDRSPRRFGQSGLPIRCRARRRRCRLRASRAGSRGHLRHPLAISGLSGADGDAGLAHERRPGACLDLDAVGLPRAHAPGRRARNAGLQGPRDPGHGRRRLRRQDRRGMQQPDLRLARHPRDRPVRFVNNRLEDFLGARPACPSASRSSWAWTGTASSSRRTSASSPNAAPMEASRGSDAGIDRAQRQHAPQLKDVRLHATLVYTNTPPHGAFRGFGGTQDPFALNSPHRRDGGEARPRSARHDEAQRDQERRDHRPRL